MKIYKQNPNNLQTVDITRQYRNTRFLMWMWFMLFSILISSSFIEGSKISVIPRDTIIVHDTVKEIGIFRNNNLTEILVPRNANVPTFCNNPGALRPSSIKEIQDLALGIIEVPSGRFLYFANAEHGFKALEILLRKVYWDRTIESMLKDYAPQFENNTEQYSKDVAKGVGMSIHTKIKDCNLKKLMKQISIIEGFKLK